MSDTLLSGRKRRESHKPKAFSPEPSGPPQTTKKATPKNAPKSATPKSAKAAKKAIPIVTEPGPSTSVLSPEVSVKKGSQKVLKAAKKTPVQNKNTPVIASSTPLLSADVPSSSSSLAPSESRPPSKTSELITSEPAALIDVSPKKPSIFSALSTAKGSAANSVTSITNLTPTAQRGLLSLRKRAYNSHSEDEGVSPVVQKGKVAQACTSEVENVEVKPSPSVPASTSAAENQQEPASSTVSETEMVKPEPSPSTSTNRPFRIKLSMKNDSEGSSTTFKPAPDSTPASAETSMSESLDSLMISPASKPAPPAHSISLRTGRERKAPPSKDYDPNTGSSHRRDSVSSGSFSTPPIRKKTKPKSNNATPSQLPSSSTVSPAPVIPPIAPVLPPPEPEKDYIEVPPSTDPTKRPKLSIRIPKAISSGSATSTPLANTPAMTPLPSGRNTPADVFSRPGSSIAASSSTDSPMKVPPIRLNLSKLASSRPETPAVGRPETPAVGTNINSRAPSPKISSRPLTPLDVTTLISMATTSRSGRIRKPPPSKEYPGHQDLPMPSTSKRKESSKPPLITTPSASMFNFPEFAIQPAAPPLPPPPSTESMIPLFGAPAMSRSDYAVNFNNTTRTLLGWISPMMADPTPASTPVSLQAPSAYAPVSSVYVAPPPQAQPSTSAPKPIATAPTTGYHRPTSLAENLFNRPSRNKSKAVADLAPSLMPRDMQKRASIASSSTNYASTNYQTGTYQTYHQPGPSSAYQIPLSAGTASHMFAYDNDYVNGYDSTFGRSVASQKRRATAPTPRTPAAKKTKTIAFDSSGEALDTSDLNIDRTIIDYGDDAIEHLKQVHKHLDMSLKHFEDDYEDNFFFREILTSTITEESDDDDVLSVGSPDPVLPPRSLDAPPPEHNRVSTKLVRDLIKLLPPVERKTLAEVKDVAEGMLKDLDIRGKALLDLEKVISAQYCMEIAIAGKPNSMATFHAYSMYNATQFRNIIFLHFSVEFMEAHAWLLQNLDEAQLGSYLTLLKYLRPAGTTLSDMFVHRTVDSVAITNEVMAKIVVERARDPYIRMLTQLKRKLKRDNVYVVLVYPGITFEDETISPIYHAHEQIFLGLSNMGAIVEKLAINNPFPKDSNPNMKQACDYSVRYVRTKLKEIVKRRAGDRVFVAAWGLPCLFVHEAVLDVSGISGLIDLAIPLLSPFGHRGIVGDKLLRTYCPSLLVVGEEAQNVVIVDVVDAIVNFVAKSGLVIVGAADDSLVVGVQTLAKYNITQACVNRLIIHHIMDFIDVIVENTQNKIHTKKLNFQYPYTISTEYATHVMRDEKEVDPAETFEEDIKAVMEERKLYGPKSPPASPINGTEQQAVSNGHNLDSSRLNDGLSKYFNGTQHEYVPSNQPTQSDGRPAQYGGRSTRYDGGNTSHDSFISKFIDDNIDTLPDQNAADLLSPVSRIRGEVKLYQEIELANQKSAQKSMPNNDAPPSPPPPPPPQPVERIIDEEMELETQRAAAALLAAQSDEDNDPF